MSEIVLVIGDVPHTQLDVAQDKLLEKGIVDRLARCPEMQTLHDAVKDALRMAEADDNPKSEEGKFYQEAFVRRTGYDLSKVVAIVITEAQEEALYRFTDDNPRFFGHYKLPVFIIRPQSSFRIDEK